MGLWASITGFFSGAGGIAAAVEEGEKLVGQVVAEVHDHNQNVAGQDKVTATVNADAAKVNANVAKAAVTDSDSAALERLRNGSA